MELLETRENIFGDNIANLKHYDFSQANMSEKHRIHAISAVASICYQSPKSIGSESLYNRLLADDDYKLCLEILEKANISKICNKYKKKKYKTKYQTCGGFKWKFKD